MAQLNFDASQVEPNAPIEVLPPGDYIVQIVGSEMKSTKDETGQMLWLEYDIIDGEFAGRKMWDRLNLVNKNSQAVEIAQRTLSAICRAVGKMAVSDSEELHFKPLIASVKVRPAGPDRNNVQREAQNEVKGYKPVGGGVQAAPVRTAPQAARPAQAAAPVAAAPTVATPPWKQRK